MDSTRTVPHFDTVDKLAIHARFIGGRQHRATLLLPFIGRTGRTLCVIGQNPSAADEHAADKTIRYIEELIYRTQPDYGALLILNLYSRVDTRKCQASDLLDARCAGLFHEALQQHDDVLLIYGKLKNERAYKFRDRAREVAAALDAKNVLRLDLETSYPPHPGNSKILYRNFKVGLVACDPTGAHLDDAPVKRSQASEPNTS